MSRRLYPLALGWLLFAGLAALCAPLLTASGGPVQEESGWRLVEYAPERTNLRERFQAPSAEHWLGTDELGRDVLARVLHGGRVTLGIGLLAGFGSLVIGCAIGAIAGHFGGWTDIVISRLIETVLSFPIIFLILAIVAALGASFWTIAIALILGGWPSEARFVRAEFLRARETDFALAAAAAGAGQLRTIFRHILPNAVGPAIVSAAFGVAGAILAESALSYLGFGIQPPSTSWGGIVGSVSAASAGAWWLLVFPGLAIFLTILSVHALADRLAMAFDPKRDRF